MYLQGRLFWHRITNCDKRSDMYDALSMYRPSEIILPEGQLYRKILRISLKINLVMLFYHHSQRTIHSVR